ncbi:hypothetical protein HJFPF1_11512 [Paramyrothecium foliicola]|nr:hypothetical protein HJFPF1_11512 [Paramyrothecium foliicola]
MPRPSPLFSPFRPRFRLFVLGSKSFARTQSSQPSQASRIERVTSKLPRGLQKYTNGLRNAPVSHVVSFLILHELTAIVPLFGLVGLFHYTDYAPVSYMTEHFGSYVQTGIVRFERYFKRKGWFGFSQEDGESTETGQVKGAVEGWESGDPKYKLLVEVALAYAITKALLPLRIIGSVWATPWCANAFLRLRKSFSRRA